MLAIALGIGAVLTLWAMYKVIVYALPSLLGLGAASLALNTGAGWIGSVVAGATAAVASFVLLRYLLTHLRSRTLRWSIGLVLIIPTATLAYGVGLDALAASVPAETWRQGAGRRLRGGDERDSLRAADRIGSRRRIAGLLRSRKRSKPEVPRGAFARLGSRERVRAQARFALTIDANSDIEALR